MWSFPEVRGRKLLITSAIINPSKRKVEHYIEHETGFKIVYHDLFLFGTYEIKATEHSVTMPFSQLVPNARSVIVSRRPDRKRST